MKRKKNNNPRRWRYNRQQRLEEGKKWLLKYEGKRLIAGYSKHFRCGKLCATEELRMLGIKIKDSIIQSFKKNTPKKIKKLKIFKDAKGEYIRKIYFINGKMKFHRIYIVDGIPADKFYRLNADPITLFQDGEFESLNEQES